MVLYIISILFLLAIAFLLIFLSVETGMLRKHNKDLRKIREDQIAELIDLLDKKRNLKL